MVRSVLLVRRNATVEQEAHDTVPLPSANFPGSHAEHTLSSPSEYVPGGHGVSTLDPSHEKPAGQLRHAMLAIV